MVRRIQLQLKVELKLDLSLLVDKADNGRFTQREFSLNIFKLTPNYLVHPGILKAAYAPGIRKWSNIVSRLTTLGYPVLEEKGLEVKKELIQAPLDNTIYRGYWQSEQYFVEFADQIRDDFSFRENTLPVSRKLLKMISETESVCLNVRRKEFLQLPTHNVTNERYFLRAVKFMLERRPDVVFFIFSDDIEWCRQTFRELNNKVIVSEEHYGEAYGNYLQLMMSCKHFIIPNSTFAWWAAWLGESRGTLVITPKKWFGTDRYNYKDIVPERWVKIPNEPV
ncbi:Glycosyl transferase family 11 [Neolewinella agarilytica]|uniref:Glycosyl transferase family 11 n=2 Tax=Neolewinella agarilytica TaxID=478744 RepID=A0A1H9J2C0_9BACT|nr:Glycosyl transferase family 11 [Neolewinella agarilytica]